MILIFILHFTLWSHNLHWFLFINLMNHISRWIYSFIVQWLTIMLAALILFIQSPYIYTRCIYLVLLDINLPYNFLWAIFLCSNLICLEGLIVCNTQMIVIMSIWQIISLSQFIEMAMVFITLIIAPITWMTTY